MTWQDVAAQRKASILDAIPAEWRLKTAHTGDSAMSAFKDSGILTAEELAITETSAADLVHSLAIGKLTAVAVTTAFLKRAALAHQLVNCLLGFMPEYALARAKSLDEYFAKHKKPSGPLHGLPISLKDQCRVKGFDTSMGYVGWIGMKDDESSVLVDLLDKAGAVFYVKTSVPQSLMVCETINNITGRTVNPRNKNWSCGGSSGGEGALIGCYGSPIGIATDIGGSIRVPAAFNFLYGIRPSHGRLPYAKLANSMEGQETIHSVVGPICHSIADMRVFMKAVLGEKPWQFDSKTIPMPWRPEEEDAIRSKISSGGLTLGVYSCDGNDIFGSLKLSGEPAIPNIQELVNPDLKKVGVNDVWDLQLSKWNYQIEYLAKIREFEAKTGRELDAIIAPITPTAAVRHNQFKYYGYATVINVLDWTSVVVPVTFADKALDAKATDFKPLSDIDATVQAEYDPEAYHGAPVAVQIIGRRLTEERIMAIAEEVGRLLKN